MIALGGPPKGSATTTFTARLDLALAPDIVSVSGYAPLSHGYPRPNPHQRGVSILKPRVCDDYSLQLRLPSSFS